MMTDSENIVRFFINIFILQSGSGEGGWEGEYVRMPPGLSPDITYELRIRRGGEVKTRRMSIRQIGVSAESKSDCYMVTYDDFLVIKIPPLPPADFDTYLENIEAEKQISEQLHPAVMSLSPGLSPILRRVPEIVKRVDQGRDASEQDYIRLLKKEPQYQRYLKISGRFVFFMELSKHAFFDQVLTGIHNEKERIREEFIRNSHLFDDLAAFESVYGGENDALFFRINDLHKQFQSALDDLLKRPLPESADVPDYEKREWLFAVLAGREPEINGTGPLAALAGEIRRLLSRVVRENPETANNYFDHARSRVRAKILDNHRANMETLILKTLDLLHRLKGQWIAIRDLKPDNILLAGKGDNDRYNLSDPGAYDLGLIDLETAFRIQGAGNATAGQPLLAGTPSFMTPSHLFDIPVLDDVFARKMPGIFHLQDWFAAIGIIFNIATGQRLFEKTSKLVPEIVRVKKRGIRKNDPEAPVLKNVSRIFWKTAAGEFDEMIRANRERLKAIQLSLPENITDLFCSEVETGKNMAREAVDRCVDSEKLASKQARQLIDASVDDVRALRIKWETKDPAQNPSPDVRERILALLKRLETLKSRLANLDKNFQRVKTPLSCEELLAFMFCQVAAAMDCE